VPRLDDRQAVRRAGQARVGQALRARLLQVGHRPELQPGRQRDQAAAVQHRVGHALRGHLRAQREAARLRLPVHRVQVHLRTTGVSPPRRPGRARGRPRARASPLCSSSIRSSSLVQPMPMMRPRSQAKAPSRAPAAVYVVTTGVVAPPVTGTSLRSSRTSAMGPP